jgi:leucyl aminopeptidase
VDVRNSPNSAFEAACDALVAFIPENDSAAVVGPLDAALGGQLAPWLASRQFTGGEGAMLVLPTLGRIPAAHVLLLGTGDGAPGKVRAAAARAAREIRGLKGSKVVAWLGPKVDPKARVAAIEGFGVGSYAWERRAEKDRTAPIASLTLAGADGGMGAPEARAETVRRWQDWVRDLVNLPPAELYPETLAARAQELAKIPGVTVEVWDDAKLKAEQCVGLIAVGQGSPRLPRMIHVKWSPAGAKARVALVGKGITFDSGGLSLKPSGGMQTMRCDMGGAASVLGAVAAAAETGIPVALDVWVASAENMIGGNSYKLSDILSYPNGVTVEIHNTDAEGRLVLADALIQASKGDSTHILDLATLTGACVVALGSDFSGVFTHDDALAADLVAAGVDTGEGLWRMPLHKPYKDGLKADWAQIRNVAGRDAGATTAALFLEHFVAKDKRWAHLDIAGPAFLEKPSGGYAAGATGQPMRAVVRWLEKLAG